MTDQNEAQPRLTPTEWSREVVRMALNRSPIRASEEVEISRNAKGDYQYSVQGIAGEEETLAECMVRVMAVVVELDDSYPLSRTQLHARQTLPAEKAGK